MNIIDRYYHRLVFRLDSDAPKKWKEKWMKFKKECESGAEHNRNIVIDIKSHCRLEQNRKLEYIPQDEGGMKHGNDKEINFRYNWGINVCPPMEKDEHIIMDQIYGEWTYEELDDLIYGFVKMTRDDIFKDMRECVKGYIELRNKDSDLEDYISE